MSDKLLGPSINHRPNHTSIYDDQSLITRTEHDIHVYLRKEKRMQKEASRGMQHANLN